MRGMAATHGALIIYIYIYIIYDASCMYWMWLLVSTGEFMGQVEGECKSLGPTSNKTE